MADEQALQTAVILLGMWGVITPVGVWIVRQWRIDEIQHEVERLIERKTWKVVQEAAEWYYGEDGSRKGRQGIAVYVVQRPRDYGDKRLPIGHVAHDEPDFLEKLTAVRAQATERASDLNALED
jgi:hypothetical protein